MTETTINNLKINILSETEYAALSTKNPNEIYLTPDNKSWPNTYDYADYSNKPSINNTTLQASTSYNFSADLTNYYTKAEFKDLLGINPYKEQLLWIQTVSGGGGTSSAEPATGCGIDTGYYPDFSDDYEVSLKFYITSSGGVTGDYLIGARPIDDGDYVTTRIFPYSGRWYYDWAAKYTDEHGRNYSSALFSIYDTVQTITITKTSMTFSATGQTSYTINAPSYGSYEHNNSLWIGTYWLDNPSHIKEYDVVRIYEFTVKESGTTVMHLIPVLSNTDVPCLYDEINKTFVYAHGSSTPTYATLS